MFEKLRRRVEDFSGKAKVKYEETEQRVEAARGKMEARQLRRLKKQREKAEARAMRAELKNVEMRRIDAAKRAMEEPSNIRHQRAMRRISRGEQKRKRREAVARARRGGGTSGFGRPPVQRRPVKSKAPKTKYHVVGGKAYPVAGQRKAASKPRRRTKPARPQRTVRSKPRKKTKWL